MDPVDRRSFLKGAAVVTGGLVTGLAPGGVWARRARTPGEHVAVYLVVVDGLRADQLHLMPRLRALADQGTYYPQARAQMVAETGPNHTAMITGLRADRNGHPGNAVPGLAERIGEDPRQLKADSLFTLMARQAPEARAASVNAKTYVVNTARHDRTGSGGPDADRIYDPPVTAPDDAARDALTGPEGIRVSAELDPDLLWWNLGDVDRAGHLDVSGTLFDRAELDGTQPAFQLAALAQADLMIGAMVDQLRARGRWERTVMIVTADHSMDWSFVDRFVDLADAFADEELLAGEVVTAVNGGACLYGLRSPDEPRAQERLARMRQIALAAEGVEEALYIRPNPLDGDEEHWVGRVHPDWGLLGDHTGELIVTVAPGWRIGHGGIDSNPIPGNHGHPATLPIPVIIAGGWDGIVQQVVEPAGQPGPGERDPSQAQNIDLAPTAAWLLGLHPPPGGFDGRVLEEAFDRRPGSRVEVANVQSLPELSRLGDDDPAATAAGLSREAWPHDLDGSGPSDALPLVVGNELLDDVMVGQRAQGTSTVVVVSGEDVDEALVVGPLAARLGAPLLLTRRDRLPAATREEVRRRRPRRALIVGSAAQVSEDVAAELDAAGVAEVERLAGEDAMDTARLVALEVGVHDDNRQVVLVDGDAALAVAASPIAAARRRPLLRTADGRVPGPTRAAFEALDIDRVLVVGGARTLRPEVADGLRHEGILVERIDGGSSGETVRLLAERAVREGAPTDDVYLVPAATPAFGLAMAAALHELRGSLLVVDERGWRGEPGEPVRRWLTERADEFVRVRLVGGARVLATRVEHDVDQLLVARRTRGSAGGTQAPTDADGASVLGGAAAIAAAAALRRRGWPVSGGDHPPPTASGADAPRVSGPGTAPGSR